MSTIVAQTLSNGVVSTSTANCIQGSAKAWINYNGVAGTISSSYNVGSVTKNSAGNYTINFTNAFTDSNYAITGAIGNATTAVLNSTTSPKTPTACQINTTAYNIASPFQYDFTEIYAAFFR